MCHRTRPQILTNEIPIDRPASMYLVGRIEFGVDYPALPRNGNVVLDDVPIVDQDDYPPSFVFEYSQRVSLRHPARFNYSDLPMLDDDGDTVMHDVMVPDWGVGAITRTENDQNGGGGNTLEIQASFVFNM